MTLESNIETVHREAKLGNGSVDGEWGHMAVERYVINSVAVEMTLKYGCIQRLGKCGCRCIFPSVTFSETGGDQVVWRMWLYMIIWGELL